MQGIPGIFDKIRSHPLTVLGVVLCGLFLAHSTKIKSFHDVSGKYQHLLPDGGVLAGISSAFGHTQKDATIADLLKRIEARDKIIADLKAQMELQGKDVAQMKLLGKAKDKIIADLRGKADLKGTSYSQGEVDTKAADINIHQKELLENADDLEEQDEIADERALLKTRTRVVTHDCEYAQCPAKGKGCTSNTECAFIQTKKAGVTVEGYCMKCAACERNMGGSIARCQPCLAKMANHVGFCVKNDAGKDGKKYCDADQDGMGPDGNGEECPA